MPSQAQTPVEAEATPNEQMSSEQLRVASDHLKAKIEEAKKANAMPIDSALGDPHWENKAADGRFDRADDEDE